MGVLALLYYHYIRGFKCFENESKPFIAIYIWDNILSNKSSLRTHELNKGLPPVLQMKKPDDRCNHLNEERQLVMKWVWLTVKDWFSSVTFGLCTRGFSFAMWDFNLNYCTVGSLFVFLKWKWQLTWQNGRLYFTTPIVSGSRYSFGEHNAIITESQWSRINRKQILVVIK